jgi:hypothetical protein
LPTIAFIQPFAPMTLRTLGPWLLPLSALFLAGCGPNLFDRLYNFWSLGICGTVVVVLDILALLELAQSNRDFSNKVLWALLIIFFPVLGLIGYYFFGRKP